MSVRHRITNDSALYLAGELIEAAANAPSADYTAYGPFEDTLVLVDATGTTIVPLPGYVATLRPGEGRFGGAVAVEEGTTNLFANPTLSIGAEQWVKSNSTVQNYDGYVRITASDTYAGVYQTVEMQEGVTYTLSYWYRHVSGAAVVGSHIDGWDESNTQIRIDKGPWIVGNTIDVPDDSQFHFIEVRHTPTSSGSKKVYLQPGRRQSEVTTGDIRTGYGFGVQLEAKPFATSFVDGTRAAGKLEYPASMLNARQGTVSVWVWPTLLYDYNYVIHSAIGDAGGNATNRFLIHLFANGSIAYEVAGFGVRVVAPPGTITAQKWAHLAMTWENGILKGYYNGLLVGTVSVGRDATIGSVVRLGREASGRNYFNGLIDELLILPYAASEEEVRSLYQTTVARFRANGDVSIKGELVEGGTGFRYGSDGNLYVNELVEGVSF